MELLTKYPDPEYDIFQRKQPTVTLDSGLFLYVWMPDRDYAGTFEGIDAKNQEVNIRDETGTLRNIPVAKARIFCPLERLSQLDAGSDNPSDISPEFKTTPESIRRYQRSEYFSFSGTVSALLPRRH
ncbi:hypothetical protein ACKJSM_03410 [Pseudomonas sp. PHC1]|uniref:hypothetical protein n=1 Tax=Pseudomonas sp. PHC1 TaxID=3384759 RepID=UPI00396F476B